MSKVITTVTDYEAKALETLVKIQDEVLGYVKQAVDFVDGRISEIELPFELPEIEALDTILDEVPTLSEVVDTQFAFSKKLLANQEKFAKNVVKAVKPLTRDAKPAAAKRTTKAAA
jgi:hypothetical protein